MSADDPMEALHIDLYSYLTPLLEVPLYDFVPEDAEYPYVVMGEATEIPDNTQDHYGTQMTLTWHVWTRTEGYSEGRKIARIIQKRLDHQQDSIPTPELDSINYRLVSLTHEMTQTMRDPNPELRHIPVRYRAVTEQITN